VVRVGKAHNQGEFLLSKSDSEAACPGHAEFLLEVAPLFMGGQKAANLPPGKNVDSINIQSTTSPRGKTVEDILGRAKSLGLKFQGEEKDLKRLSELNELLLDAKHQREYLQEEGEDTTLQNWIIHKVCVEIRVLVGSEKVR